MVNQYSRKLNAASLLQKGKRSRDTLYLFQYLYYVFLSGSCFDGLGKMGTQLNLNTETVGSIFIAVPPENQISKILQHIKTETSTIDIAIAKAEREIELIREYKEAMIAESVMGKRK